MDVKAQTTMGSICCCCIHLSKRNFKYKLHIFKELLLTAQKAEVWMRTANIGNKCFVLEYAVLSHKDGKTILRASGTSTQVMFDMKTRTTIEVEDWIRERLTAFEA